MCHMGCDHCTDCISVGTIDLHNAHTLVFFCLQRSQAWAVLLRSAFILRLAEQIVAQRRGIHDRLSSLSLKGGNAEVIAWGAQQSLEYDYGIGSIEVTTDIIFAISVEKAVYEKY